MVLETDNLKRKIHDLRVVDLRNELEKRGLDKSGVKATLVTRLSKALQDEGHDPDEYAFDTSGGTEKRTPKRGSAGRQEADTVSNPDSTLDVVDVSFTQEFEEEPKEEVKEETKPAVVAEEVEETKEAEERKEEEKKEEPATEQPSQMIVQESNDGGEDSINLTLEDEENFDEEEQPKYKDVTLNEQTIGGAAKSESRRDSSKHGQSTNKDAAGRTGDGKSETGTGVSSSEEKSTVESSSAQGEKAKSTTSSSSAGNKEQSKGGPKDERDKKKASSSNGSNSSGRNLWVSGLSSTTRATDLKALFSKHGKVVGAKVVTNARTPGARCYGYVTMSSSEDAAKCIQHIHRTELHGRIISVERAKGGDDQSKADGKPPIELSESKLEDKVPKADSAGKTESTSSAKNDSAEVKSAKEDKAPPPAAKEKEDKGSKVTGSEKDRQEVGKDAGKEKEKPARDLKEGVGAPAAAAGGGGPAGEGIDRRKKMRFRNQHGRGGRQSVLTFNQIREERERQRQRDRERELRENERRRREEAANLREQERRQREEFVRLERERERLRLEREKLDREKAELLRLERETQRLERERIEREREELRRQQARSMARIEEVRRAVKRPAVDERELLDERKRAALEPPARRYDPAPGRYDPPAKPSAHFGAGPAGSSVDYRGAKATSDRDYERGRGDRFERGAPPPPSHASTSSHRRLIAEAPVSSSRDARAPPPSSGQRERDDRRVVDRSRDDRADRDRGGRASLTGRDVYSERDRPRERVPEREPIRNRLDRDHRGERYPDSHSKGGDLRYSERGSSSNLLGNGLAASHTSRDHSWGAASERKPEPLMGSASSWAAVQGQSASDRWGPSHGSLSRSLGSSAAGYGGSGSAWASSASGLPVSGYGNSASAALVSQLAGSLHNHSSDANYGGDRYSRR